MEIAVLAVLLTAPFVLKVLIIASHFSLEKSLIAGCFNYEWSTWSLVDCFVARYDVKINWKCSINEMLRDLLSPWNSSDHLLLSFISCHRSHKLFIFYWFPNINLSVSVVWKTFLFAWFSAIKFSSSYDDFSKSEISKQIFLSQRSRIFVSHFKNHVL